MINVNKNIGQDEFSSHHLSVSLESEQGLLKSHQSFYGHGKLLLSGEYFVLDGAKALALPTVLGQNLSVDYEKSYQPKLMWKSFDYDANVWFEGEFEFWHFNIMSTTDKKVSKFLQKVLRQARKQNPHFLREELNIKVETKLSFPLCWGLGSSSTLIYNIAQWAYVSPFELHFKTCGGSGYDIACAGSDGPILYEKKSSGPNWSPVRFDPSFKDNLFFVYLGHKKDTNEAIKEYQSLASKSPTSVNRISEITEEIFNCENLSCFNKLIVEHEDIVSKSLKMEKVKDCFFKDFWGEVKSLGAWGGDFVLLSSDRSKKETQKYLQDQGFDVVISFNDLILDPKTAQMSQSPTGFVQ